ncbi:hypothetical protein [Streptomyces sp. BBFR102]|uniref:hypothetical protein n=1 Tax=Streptomyces sp. BBFR102 TaxID=3448171 RepID=UPI003F52A5D7
MASAQEPATVLIVAPMRLRQAIGNLLSDALRHAPAGGQVTVRVYLAEPANEQKAGGGRRGGPRRRSW